MTRQRTQHLLLALPLLTALTAAQDPMPKDLPADPFLWLEDVDGETSLDWVRARNEESKAALINARFDEHKQRALSILESDDRIAYVAKRGEHYYNLWQDADHPRGVWRRTGWESYLRDEPEWEVVLDLDALGEAEGESWVWKGSTWLMPDRSRCLLSLSRGGADATVVREFDPKAKAFVDGGFELPEAKSQVAWRDQDTLYVGTDFGEGSMTESGYPRVVKIWRRGAPLADAEMVFQGEASDMYAYAFHDHTEGFERDFIYRGVTFYTNEMFWLHDGAARKLNKPDSANASVHRDWLLLELREDWSVDGAQFAAGSLLVTKFDDFMAGERTFEVLFAPTERSSLSGWSGTENHLLINVLDNVRNVVYVATHGEAGWQRKPLPGLPEFGTVSVSPVDGDQSDDYWLTITDFLTPTSLWRGTIDGDAPTKLKSLPAFFNADDLVVEQRQATSKDGTIIPYFLITKKDLKRDGRNPTLLYGYGGFEISLTPQYSATVGACWLEQGGTYAVANIRGGGEFGPRWHQAALKQNRNKCYEDFAAVARALIDAKITSPRHLGIQGGSNGGLLMGNMTVMYPELFRAVVCQVPLLDMLRYDKLLAGASWTGEYGDPDVPAEAAWLRRYSPYHNLNADADYPKVLFTTSTRDDRVHPGHARKMMARMLKQGHDVLYYENMEGGHGGAADAGQAAFMSAIAWTFLWETLP